MSAPTACEPSNGTNTAVDQRGTISFPKASCRKAGKQNLYCAVSGATPVRATKYFPQSKRPENIFLPAGRRNPFRQHSPTTRIPTASTSRKMLAASGREREVNELGPAGNPLLLIKNGGVVYLLAGGIRAGLGDRSCLSVLGIDDLARRRDLATLFVGEIESVVIDFFQ